MVRTAQTLPNRLLTPLPLLPRITERRLVAHDSMTFPNADWFCGIGLTRSLTLCQIAPCCFAGVLRSVCVCACVRVVYYKSVYVCGGGAVGVTMGAQGN